MPSASKLPYDAIIVGAGAAGLMCAMRAAQRCRRVVLIDHAGEPGKKILISGGGRCNFTNLHSGPESFVSANPHFCRSALARFTPQDFIGLVEKHRIGYHEKTLGQLFCDSSARQIVAMLLAECEAAGVDLRLGRRISSVEHGDGFCVVTDRGTFRAPSLVLATGGLSIPKMGATGFAYDVARQFGLGVTATRPGLVPLTFGADDLTMMRPLSGVAVDAEVRCGGASFREAVLFTHRGLSGPAILQASSYWREGEAITVDLLPGTDAAALLRERKRDRPKAAAKTVLAEILPQRLAEAFAEIHLPPRVLAETPDKALDALGLRLNGWKLLPNGSEGYAKAEVTVGGIDTRGLSSKTMEARDLPGLYAIGEAVDVTGWLGGYNFQWAWSSGWAAAEAL